jgi:phage terminase small subunit
LAEEYQPPHPPPHLNATGARFWESFASDWALEDTDDLELLRLACEALDRATQARKALRREGLTYVDRFGAPHSRPEVAIERQARTSAAAIVKQIQTARLTIQRLEDAANRENESPARRGGGTRRHG